MSGLTNEVGSLIGGGGPNNAGYTASNANNGQGLIMPTTAANATAALGTANTALASQSALATALQAGGTQGMNSQSNLATALQAQANGTGPNPAQAALNQNTGTNVANQAALMAGQRGSSANAGLIARQAAQTGAATQQAAVGQGATLQAQQEIAAQQQQAGLAATQVGQETGQTNAAATSAENEQANVLNSINSENNAAVGIQSNMNSVNGGLAQTNANNSAGFVGGVLNGLGAAGASTLNMAEGGEVVKKGQRDPGANKKLAKVAKKDRLPLPKHIKGMADIFHKEHFADGGYVAVTPINTPISGGNEAIGNSSPLKDQDKSASSPEDEDDTGVDAGQGMDTVMAGGAGDAGGASVADLALLAYRGAEVPGKPKVDGKNTQKNDVVPAMLTPKEIVLPLSVTEADDAPAAAAKFVAAIQAKNGKGNGKEHEDFKSALKTAMKSRKK